MQEASTPLPDWAFKAILWLASFVGLRGTEKLITVWLNRKKPEVEAKKTEAETTEIRIRSYSTAAESQMRMMQRLQDTLDDIDRVRDERDRIRDERDRWRERAEAAESQVKIDEHFIKRLSAANELKLKLSDLDNPKS